MIQFDHAGIVQMNYASGSLAALMVPDVDSILPMQASTQLEVNVKGIGFRLRWVYLFCLLSVWLISCKSHHAIRVAVIPQTDGTGHWEPLHAGAEFAADRAGISIYWNAPTREDDIEAQIALVERVVKANFQGLVLAPDQALSLITPVRRAMAHDIPTVIIGSPLPIPPGRNLSYILNDDAAGGRLAAQHIAGFLHGHGKVAVLGIDPDVSGIMLRARSFDEFLIQNDPGIHIVERRFGAFNVPHEQQVAEDVLAANPDLDVIVALNGSASDGSMAAIASAPKNRSVKVVAFDLGGYPLFDHEGRLESVIQEDSRAIGQQAVELIEKLRMGQSVSGQLYVQPKLITRQNLDTAEIRLMLDADWKLGHWAWRQIP